MNEQVQVLIADDDAKLVEVLSRELGDAGYACTAVADGAAAIEALEARDFDVALLDLIMPKKTGFEVLEHIQQAQLGVIPMVLTGAGDVSKAVHAIKLGAYDFLEKPCNPELLLNAVHRASNYRKARLQALRLEEAAAQWQSTFDASPDMLLVLDLEGRIVYANRAAAARADVPPESLPGQFSHDVFCGGAHTVDVCPLAGRSTATVHALWDGWFEVEHVPLHDKNRAVWGQMIVVRDYTRRHQAKLALLENEARLKTILDTILTGVLVIDEETHTILDVNPQAEELIGTSRENIVGHICHQFVCPAEVGKCPVTDLGQNVDRSERVLVTVQGERIPVLKTVTRVWLNGRRCLLDSFLDIRDLKQIENELRESEERHRALFESSQDAIMTLEPPTWRFTSGNPACIAMFGAKDEAEFITLGPWDVSPEFQPDQRPSGEKAKEMIETAMREGSNLFEWTHKRLGGEDFPATVLLTRVQLGDYAFVQATVRDISEQKRLAKEREQVMSEVARLNQEMEFILGASNTGLDIIDSEFNLKYVDKEWQKVYGDYAGKKCFDYFMGSDDICPGCGIVKALETKEPVVTEEVLVRENNRRVQVTSIPFQDPEGNWLAAEVNVDITKRKQAEEALQQSEERYRTLFECSHDAIMTLEPPTWSFTSGNPACISMYGAKDEAEFIACGPWDVSPEFQPDQRPSGEKAKEMIETAMREGSNFFEWTHKRLGGEDFPATVLLTRVQIGEHIFLQATVRDVSRQKQMEMELSQAQKLEAVGRLAAGIAHEINTPTQYVGDNIEFLQETCESISGLIQALGRIVEAGKEAAVPPELIAETEELIENAQLDFVLEEIPKALEQSLEGVGRISTIVQAMKEFSHPGRTEKTAVDLNQCIRSTATVSRNEWKYVAELELELDDTLPHVTCLPGDFNQAILNMIVNAAHAIGDMQSGVEGEKGKIAISTRQDGEWAEIRIADTGGGIPEAVRERIFEPFFTTKEVGRGTGQGLAIARNVVVDKHEGILKVESEVGKGTTFILRLPIKPRPAAGA